MRKPVYALIFFIALFAIISFSSSEQTRSIGDSGQATQALLRYPDAIVLDNTGNIYIADDNGRRVRKIDAITKIITTVAGNGEQGYSGDGGAAINARMSVAGLAIDYEKNLYILDGASHRVRKVDIKGIITTMAGTGESGFYGDGGQAINAKFKYPAGLFIDNFNNLLIADAWNHAIRKIFLG